jgi:lysozyme family protein
MKKKFGLLYTGRDMLDFEKAVTVVLKHEGGYSNNLRDRGGATKYGISLRYLKSVGLDLGDIDLDGDIDIDDIKGISISAAKSIYQSQFWEKYNCDKLINQDIATKVFDMCVNMGGKQAIKLLQRAYNRAVNARNLVVDGVLGEQTLAAVNSCKSQQQLLAVLRSEQAMYYERLIYHNRELAEFRKGWLKRAYA